MSWPTIRSGADLLRALVIGTGLCWSVAFVAVALGYKLELYADGAMFSYAVAVQDVWAFHWHNISGRMSVFFLSLLPAEAYVGLSGNPGAGIVVYGLLVLSRTARWADRHVRGRPLARPHHLRLCLLFDGPALPADLRLSDRDVARACRVLAGARRLPVCKADRRRDGSRFRHDADARLSPMRARWCWQSPSSRHWLRAACATPSFLRAAAILIVVLAMAAATKIMLPPDDYYAGVFLRAALHFFDFTIFQVSIVVLLLAALAGYGVILLVFSRLIPERAYLYAAAIVVVMLLIYWLWFDHAIHASSRYYLRTALVIVTPIFGALAALGAMAGDGTLAFPLPGLIRALIALRDRAALPLAAAFMLVTLVHVVETGKFVAAWRHYRTAVAALAVGDEADPALGDPRFVSSNRIASDLNRLSWFSTTPYLSVALSNFAPNRLVIDPAGNYFWLSCATATANEKATRSAPQAGRELIRVYSCLHR